MSVSTHVLDATRGHPAEGVPVRLTTADGRVLAEAVTDADGRVAGLAGELPLGVYRLVFAVEEYLTDTFFPEVSIAFKIRDRAASHHVPLLLSPYAYSTYRGS